MDDIAFDRLTRLFGSPRSRRGGIRAVLGLLLGGAGVTWSSNALANDGDDEVGEEAFAGGRGALDNFGGRRRGRQQDRDQDRRDNKSKDPKDKNKNPKGKGKKSKGKNENSCAKAGEKRKRGKPCCKGLVRDDNGRCAEPLTPSACNDASCPADVSTVSSGPGSCCETGYCTCGGGCCAGPDCWIRTVEFRSGEITTFVTESCARPTGCLRCPNSGTRCCEDCSESGDCLPPCIDCPDALGDACCIDCLDEAPFCVEQPDNTPIAGGSIRRR